MLDKIQFGDYNRFLVSIGLILVAIGLALPYFYMKETFDLLMKKDDIVLLTPIAQQIINDRQLYAQKMISVIPIASLFIVVIGFVLLIIGGFNWRKKQTIEDEKVIQENNKLDAERRKIEAETSQILKGAEKIPQKEIIESKVKEIKNEQPNISDNEKDLSVSNYLLIETLIADKFKQEYSNKYNVYTNYRVNHQEFDIILEYINNNTKVLNLGKDVIVEIKYARKIDKRYVRDTLVKMENSIKAYPKAITNPIIFFISAEQDIQFDRNELLSEIIEEWSEKAISKWHIKFLSVKDLPLLKLRETINF